MSRREWWANVDPNCKNCNGVGCMDCRLRHLHDECEHNCPTCGPKPERHIDLRTEFLIAMAKENIQLRRGLREMARRCNEQRYLARAHEELYCQLLTQLRVMELRAAELEDGGE